METSQQFVHNRNMIAFSTTTLLHSIIELEKTIAKRTLSNNQVGKTPKNIQICRQSCYQIFHLVLVHYSISLISASLMS